jgi:hypothetical protein
MEYYNVLCKVKVIFFTSLFLLYPEIISVIQNRLIVRHEIQDLMAQKVNR